jgi:hypothetical protein
MLLLICPCRSATRIMTSRYFHKLQSISHNELKVTAQCNNLFDTVFPCYLIPVRAPISLSGGCGTSLHTKTLLQQYYISVTIATLTESPKIGIRPPHFLP